VEKFNYLSLDRWVAEVKPETMGYEEAVNVLNTGDILIFRGDGLFSKWIMRVTWSPFSHAAFVVKDPTPALKSTFNCTDPNERLWVWESDTVTFDERKGGGVQLVPLRKWLEIGIEDTKVDGNCFIRRLKNYHTDRSDWSKLYELECFMLSMKGLKYEVNKAQLLSSVTKANRTEDLSSVFCSELVAASLKVMNVLTQEVNSSNCTPADFTSTCKKPLPLSTGISLKKEVRVYLNSPLRAAQPPTSEAHSEAK